MLGRVFEELGMSKKITMIQNLASLAVVAHACDY
jgi:hypothetical protein